MAGLSIVIDMGRPDRVFNIIRYWPERVDQSPLTWDVTVITLSTAVTIIIPADIPIIILAATLW